MKDKVIEEVINNDALKAGMEMFPTKIVGTRDSMFGPQPLDANEFKRMVFIEGYRQGVDRTIKKVIEWIKANCEEHIWWMDGDCGLDEEFYEKISESLKIK